MENIFNRIPLEVLLKYNDVIDNIHELQLRIACIDILKYIFSLIFAVIVVIIIDFIIKKPYVQKLIPNNIKKLITIMKPLVILITIGIMTVITVILFFSPFNKIDYNLNNIPNQIQKNIISDTPNHLEKELEKQEKIKTHIENKYPELKNAKKIIIKQEGQYYYYDIKYDTKEIVINIK